MTKEGSMPHVFDVLRINSTVRDRAQLLLHNPGLSMHESLRLQPSVRTVRPLSKCGQGREVARASTLSMFGQLSSSGPLFSQQRLLGATSSPQTRCLVNTGRSRSIDRHKKA